MTDRATVLFVCPTVACYVGGTETVVAQLVQRLKGNVELTLLSGLPEPGRKLLIAPDGYRLATLPFAGRDSGLNRFLSKTLRISRFKIESHSFFRSLAKSRFELSRYDRIATFYEADAYLLATRYPQLGERLRHLLPGVSIRRFFRRVPARQVVFFGYRAAPRARRKWGVEVRSLPLGVDAMFFPAQPPACPPDKRLLFVGRLDASKHVDWLADFFAGSGLARDGYRLEVVGDGPLLEELLARHRDCAAIAFHGRKTQQEVAQLLRGAFLLLHPSDLESFGLTILESMAAGVPVVTHGLDSVRIWAHEHPRYAAYLDRASWLQEIRRFEQRAYWERTSAANLEFAKGFSWDRIADEVLSIVLAPA